MFQCFKVGSGASYKGGSRDCAYPVIRIRNDLESGIRIFKKSFKIHNIVSIRLKVRAAYAMEILTYLSVFQRQVCNIDVSMIFKQNRRICHLRFQILEYIIPINR